MEVAQKLAKQIMDATHANGMNILSNVNEVAGQSVPHFHIHLIPRYREDDACVIEFKESEPQDLNEVLSLIKNNEGNFSFIIFLTPPFDIYWVFFIFYRLLASVNDMLYKTHFCHILHKQLVQLLYQLHDRQ